MKKHIVLIKSKKPEKFNYCKFGSYKDRKGKIVKLIDPLGIDISGYEMHQAVLSLNINDEYDKRVYEFLKDHPLCNKLMKIEDLSAKEREQADISLAKADSVTKAATLTDGEVKDFCRLVGLNGNWDDNIRRAKLISYASDNPQRFLEILNDADGAHKLFIIEALDKKMLERVNGVYKYGSETIGLTQDQAIVWLKDNADIYALLKNELRGNVVFEAESDPVPVKVKEDKGKATFVAELEKDSK